jgi:hypothetical protein
MAIGTDKEIFAKVKKRVKSGSRNGGRPKVSRDLVIRLLKSKGSDGSPRYNLTQIAKSAECSQKTVSRIRDEAIEQGLLDAGDFEESPLSMTEADFDAECIRAKGYSFYEWLGTNLKKPKYVFNFCEKIWVNLWDRPSLVDVRDMDHPLGDQLCIQFLKAFQEDEKRIRTRKKHIRYIFRFLNRNDLCDIHLRMRKPRDTVAVRRIPEISMTDFPLKLEKVVDMMSVFYPDAFLVIYGKIAQQVRTGKVGSGRELWGLTKGSDSSDSFIVMSDIDNYRIHYKAKGNEHWDIQWLPYEVRKRFWERYNKLEFGDHFLKGISASGFVKKFGQISKKIFGRKLTMHDLRKVSITWLYVLGVPFEIATSMNVGWRDLNTPKMHYLDIGKVLRKGVKQEYADNIPDWFKEGLDEFMSDEAYDKIMPNVIQND